MTSRFKWILGEKVFLRETCNNKKFQEKLNSNCNIKLKKQHFESILSFFGPKKVTSEEYII